MSSENANPVESTQGDMQDSNFVYKPSLIEWRRSTVLSHYAAGQTMTSIAELLKVDISTVSRDIAFLRQQAKEKQGEYIDNLPFRHKLRTANIDRVITELWKLYEDEKDSRTRKGILDSISDAIIKQAAIDGDPLAIDRALKAVARIKKAVQEREAAA